MPRTLVRISLLGVNAYLLKDGEGFVLVDTGHGFAWPRLIRALRDAGCVPGSLSLIVITHGDADHTGNMARLRAEYSAPVAVHPADLERIESGRMPKRTSPTTAGRTVLRLLSLRALLLPSGRAVNRFDPDVLLEDGMRLEKYGLAAEVVHIPGHTPGSVAILCDDGPLLSGDTIYESPRALLLIENVDDHRHSVERLRGLAPRVTMVCPGHGKPFSGASLTRAVL
jgi:glyoxylase-like metal-dependent hydrolase (beta-lactamase superfamily II)